MYAAVIFNGTLLRTNGVDVQYAPLHTDPTGWTAVITHSAETKSQPLVGHSCTLLQAPLGNELVVVGGERDQLRVSVLPLTNRGPSTSSFSAQTPLPAADGQEEGCSASRCGSSSSAAPIGDTRSTRKPFVWSSWVVRQECDGDAERTQPPIPGSLQHHAACAWPARNRVLVLGGECSSQQTCSEATTALHIVGPAENDWVTQPLTGAAAIPRLKQHVMDVTQVDGGDFLVVCGGFNASSGAPSAAVYLVDLSSFTCAAVKQSLDTAPPNFTPGFYFALDHRSKHLFWAGPGTAVAVADIFGLAQSGGRGAAAAKTKDDDGPHVENSNDDEFEFWGVLDIDQQAGLKLSPAAGGGSSSTNFIAACDGKQLVVAVLEPAARLGTCGDSIFTMRFCEGLWRRVRLASGSPALELDPSSSATPRHVPHKLPPNEHIPTTSKKNPLGASPPPPQLLPAHRASRPRPATNGGRPSGGFNGFGSQRGAAALKPRDHADALRDDVAARKDVAGMGPRDSPTPIIASRAARIAALKVHNRALWRMTQAGAPPTVSRASPQCRVASGNGEAKKGEEEDEAEEEADEQERAHGVVMALLRHITSTPSTVSLKGVRSGAAPRCPDRTIDLRNLSCTREDWVLVATVVAELQAVTALDISGHRLTKPDFDLLISAARSNPRLRTIRCDGTTRVRDDVHDERSPPPPPSSRGVDICKDFLAVTEENRNFRVVCREAKLQQRLNAQSPFPERQRAQLQLTKKQATVAKAFVHLTFDEQKERLRIEQMGIRLGFQYLQYHERRLLMQIGEEDWVTTHHRWEQKQTILRISEHLLEQHACGRDEQSESEAIDYARLLKQLHRAIASARRDMAEFQKARRKERDLVIRDEKLARLRIRREEDERGSWIAAELERLRREIEHAAQERRQREHEERVQAIQQELDRRRAEEEARLALESAERERVRALQGIESTEACRREKEIILAEKKFRKELRELAETSKATAKKDAMKRRRSEERRLKEAIPQALHLRHEPSPDGLRFVLGGIAIPLLPQDSQLVVDVDLPDYMKNDAGEFISKQAAQDLDDISPEAWIAEKTKFGGATVSLRLHHGARASDELFVSTDPSPIWSEHLRLSQGAPADQPQGSSAGNGLDLGRPGAVAFGSEKLSESGAAILDAESGKMLAAISSTGGEVRIVAIPERTDVAFVSRALHFLRFVRWSNTEKDPVSVSLEIRVKFGRPRRSELSDKEQFIESVKRYDFQIHMQPPAFGFAADHHDWILYAQGSGEAALLPTLTALNIDLDVWENVELIFDLGPAIEASDWFAFRQGGPVTIEKTNVICRGTLVGSVNTGGALTFPANRSPRVVGGPTRAVITLGRSATTEFVVELLRNVGFRSDSPAPQNALRTAYIGVSSASHHIDAFVCVFVDIVRDDEPTVFEAGFSHLVYRKSQPVPAQFPQLVNASASLQRLYWFEGGLVFDVDTLEFKGGFLQVSSNDPTLKLSFIPHPENDGVEWNDARSHILVGGREVGEASIFDVTPHAQRGESDVPRMSSNRIAAENDCVHEQWGSQLEIHFGEASIHEVNMLMRSVALRIHDASGVWKSVSIRFAAGEGSQVVHKNVDIFVDEQLLRFKSVLLDHESASRMSMPLGQMSLHAYDKFWDGGFILFDFPVGWHGNDSLFLFEANGVELQSPDAKTVSRVSGELHTIIAASRRSLAAAAAVAGGVGGGSVSGAISLHEPSPTKRHATLVNTKAFAKKKLKDKLKDVLCERKIVHEEMRGRQLQRFWREGDTRAQLMEVDLSHMKLIVVKGVRIGVLVQSATALLLLFDNEKRYVDIVHASAAAQGVTQCSRRFQAHGGGGGKHSADGGSGPAFADGGGGEETPLKSAEGGLVHQLLVKAVLQQIHFSMDEIIGRRVIRVTCSDGQPHVSTAFIEVDVAVRAKRDLYMYDASTTIGGDSLEKSGAASARGRRRKSAVNGTAEQAATQGILGSGGILYRICASDVFGVAPFADVALRPSEPAEPTQSSEFESKVAEGPRTPPTLDLHESRAIRRQSDRSRRRRSSSILPDLPVSKTRGTGAAPPPPLAEGSGGPSIGSGMSTSLLQPPSMVSLHTPESEIAAGVFNSVVVSADIAAGGDPFVDQFAMMHPALQRQFWPQETPIVVSASTKVISCDNVDIGVVTLDPPNFTGTTALRIKFNSISADVRRELTERLSEANAKSADDLPSGCVPAEILTLAKLQRIVRLIVLRRDFYPGDVAMLVAGIHGTGPRIMELRIGLRADREARYRTIVFVLPPVISNGSHWPVMLTEGKSSSSPTRRRVLSANLCPRMVLSSSSERMNDGALVVEVLMELVSGPTFDPQLPSPPAGVRKRQRLFGGSRSLELTWSSLGSHPTDHPTDDSQHLVGEAVATDEAIHVVVSDPREEFLLHNGVLTYKGEYLGGVRDEGQRWSLHFDLLSNCTPERLQKLLSVICVSCSTRFVEEHAGDRFTAFVTLFRRGELVARTPVQVAVEHVAGGGNEDSRHQDAATTEGCDLPIAVRGGQPITPFPHYELSAFGMDFLTSNSEVLRTVTLTVTLEEPFADPLEAAMVEELEVIAGGRAHSDDEEDRAESEQEFLVLDRDRQLRLFDGLEVAKSRGEHAAGLSLDLELDVGAIKEHAERVSTVTDAALPQPETAPALGTIVADVVARLVSQCVVYSCPLHSAPRGDTGYARGRRRAVRGFFINVKATTSDSDDRSVLVDRNFSAIRLYQFPLFPTKNSSALAISREGEAWTQFVPRAIALRPQPGLFAKGVHCLLTLGPDCAGAATVEFNHQLITSGAVTLKKVRGRDVAASSGGLTFESIKDLMNGSPTATAADAAHAESAEIDMKQVLLDGRRVGFCALPISAAAADGGGPDADRILLTVLHNALGQSIPMDPSTSIVRIIETLFEGIVLRVGMQPDVANNQIRFSSRGTQRGRAAPKPIVTTAPAGGGEFSVPSSLPVRMRLHDIHLQQFFSHAISLRVEEFRRPITSDSSSCDDGRSADVNGRLRRASHATGAGPLTPRPPPSDSNRGSPSTTRSSRAAKSATSRTSVHASSPSRNQPRGRKL